MAVKLGDPKYSMALKFTTQSTGKSITRTINYINLDKIDKHPTEQTIYGYSPTQLDAFRQLYATAMHDAIFVGETINANYPLEVS